MLEITKISDRVIEVGVDPLYNNDYEDCYATRFSIDEVKAMLTCLGLDYDKNQELLDEQAQSIKLLREAIEGALRISDLWVPSHVDIEYQGEAEALHIMRSMFIEALDTTRSNHE